MHAVMKPQYVDHIPRTAKGSVGTYMDTKGKGHEERVAGLMTTLQLDHVRDRDVSLPLLIGHHIIIISHRCRRFAFEQFGINLELSS